MRIARVAATLALSCIAAVSCIIPTGTHGGGGGHQQGTCSSATFLNDDFSSGALANWYTQSGQPTVSQAVGDPPPAADLSNAGVQSIPGFFTTATCGLTLRAAVRLDTGIAILKLVVPGVSRVAQVNVFDSIVVYRLCQSTGCVKQVDTVINDMGWHVYQYTAVAESATTRWTRDGVVSVSVGGVNTVYGTLRLNMGVFPTDSAGIGPSRGYFDNVLVTSP